MGVTYNRPHGTRDGFALVYNHHVQHHTEVCLGNALRAADRDRTCVRLLTRQVLYQRELQQHMPGKAFSTASQDVVRISTLEIHVPPPPTPSRARHSRDCI
jgi:hypothetical protein